MKVNFLYAPKITRKLLVMIFSFIILAHFVLFVVFTQHNKRAERKINRYLIVQQIINLVENINYASPKQRAKVVKDIDIPNITLSMDTTPKWSLKFQQLTSLWKISQVLRKQRSLIQFSLKFGKNQWLNVSASIISTSWWLQIFLLILEMVVVSSILFTIWSVNRFSEPLKNFTEAAERLGVDLDSPPLAEYGPVIVRRTAHAMNRMQERIRGLISERTQMLAALSHDLRTPITRMKLRAQFICGQEQYRKTILDLDQMEKMIAETLTFAKNESRFDAKAKLDLGSLLASIQDDFKDMDYNVSYIPIDKRLIVLGSSVALKRAINNLVENAIKYAGSAQIALKIYGKTVEIFIDDNGPGISKEHLTKVFEPFYRADNSRSRETGGTGLGLSIARDIIRAHAGVIKIETRKSGGLRVLVKLPIL